ncbi:MAG: ABC transporter permease subunit [Defluviitaleaceae bacterium]|nr:ABC transporter permease subunit [Defluviitaleaceae bacterium]
MVKPRSGKRWSRIKREGALHVMLLPAVVLLIIFSYVPMAGIIMSFQNFRLGQGIFNSAFVGLDNYRFLLSLPNTMQVLQNTIIIAVSKIIAGLIVPIIIALLLNEIRRVRFARGVQLTLYLPNFLSWVILGGILVDILSPSTGIVNQFISFLGFEPIFFLGDPRWFRTTMVVTDVWREFGWRLIIFMAALTAVDLTLYEAAIVDGAGRWKQMLHITLPSITPIIILVATLALGNVLNAGFDQIFNLYSPQVFHVGDILDTFIFRLGMADARFSLAAAAGLFRSIVSCVLISISYYLAYRFADYRIF